MRSSLGVLVVGSAVGLAAMSAGPGGARAAEPLEGFYIGAGAGLNLLPDTSATLTNLPGSGGNATAPFKMTWDAGVAAVGSVGYGFGNGLRLELEGSYRGNDQSNPGVAHGRVEKYGVMANLLFDIDTGLDWLVPYIGGGVGYQWSNFSGVGASASGATLVADDTQGGLAYQAIGGVAFPIAAVPGLAITAEYRYLNLSASRTYRASSSPAQATGRPGVRLSDEASHSFMLGVRYAFGVAPEGPPERPPLVEPSLALGVTPARTYLVFFDWNSAELTPRARDIVAEAVRNAPKVPHTVIEVSGHADRSGSPAYNMKLSERRAEAVAAEMERDGIARSAMDIHAYGDTRPLVPTAAGVREPQNRRVEIVYR